MKLPHLRWVHTNRGELPAQGEPTWTTTPTDSVFGLGTLMPVPLDAVDGVFQKTRL